MKKIASTTMAFVIMLLCTVPFISGCRRSEKNAYTVTQWLDVVERNFGMDYYTEPEPILQSVFTSSPDFDTIQIAAEWGLISPEDVPELDSYITKEFCADTLVTAMNFTDTATVDITDFDKIDPSYVENVKIAVENGVFSLDNGKFDPKAELTKGEADVALTAAYDKWINFSFNGVEYDESVVKENVVNLGSLDENISPVADCDYKVDYSGSTDFFGEDGQYTDNTIKTITFQKNDMPDISAGSVMTLPADDVVPMDYAVVVESVSENDDGTVTVHTRNAELEEIYDEIKIQKSEVVDFSDAVFYAPDGTKIEMMDGEPEPMMFADEDAQIEKLGLYVPGNGLKTEKTASVKGSKTIDLGDGLEATFYVKGEEIGVKLKLENKSGDVTASVETSAKLTLKIDSKVDLGFFRLKSALLKASSSQEVSTKFKYSLKKSGGINESTKRNCVLKELYNEFGKLVNEGKKAGGLVGKAYCKKILDISLGNGFHLALRVGMNVEGELEFTLGASEAFGVEYVNGKLRKISDFSTKQDLSLSGKFEATLSPALTWQLLGRTIADAGAEGGLGVKLSSKLYESNEVSGEIESECGFPYLITAGIAENAGLPINMSKAEIVTKENIQSCLDFRVYPIFKLFVCSGSSLVGKYVGSIEVSILGEDNPIYVKHWESDNGVVADCSRGVSESYDIETGKDLTLNLKDLNKLVLYVGEEYTNFKIATLPKGLTVDDVKITVEDPSVLGAEKLMSIKKTKAGDRKIKVTMKNKLNDTSLEGEVFYKDFSKDVKDQFKLVGLADGTTKLTVSAGNYSKTVEVVVGNGGLVKAETGRFSLKDTSMNLNGGSGGRIEITSFPEGYDMSGISFTSSDPSIASVDPSGNVTGGNVSGSAIITVSTNDGLYSVSCLVNVIADSDALNGFAGGGGGGGGGRGW